MVVDDLPRRKREELLALQILSKPSRNNGAADS